MVRWDGVHDDLPRIRIRWITELQYTGSFPTKDSLHSTLNNHQSDSLDLMPKCKTPFNEIGSTSENPKLRR